tara:strand:- start:350 stop:496 length:147 start_codon:yes stop_codon:yes gene_type:complete
MVLGVVVTDGVEEGVGLGHFEKCVIFTFVNCFGIIFDLFCFVRDWEFS